MGRRPFGRTTVYAILKQLERFELGRPAQGPPTLDLIAESCAWSFADRDTWLPIPTLSTFQPPA